MEIFKKTPYQEISIKVLELILNDKEAKEIITTPGIKKIVDPIIRHYCEITPDNQLTYNKVDRYKKYFRITERAARALENNKDDYKYVHSEHIYPVSQIFQDIIKLIESKPNEYIQAEEIERILNRSEIVILSKEEARVLDGNTNQYYELEGEQVQGKGLRTQSDIEIRLNAIGAKLDKRYENNTLI